MEDTILVFTSRSCKQTVDNGDVRFWVLNHDRAHRCRYVALAWNSLGKHVGEYPNEGYKHGEIFFVGEMDSIVLAEATEKRPGRSKIRFREWSPASVQCGFSQRNPVKYTSLEALGLNATDLTFRPYRSTADTLVSVSAQIGGPQLIDPDEVRPLSVLDAKRGLAKILAIPIECITITINA